MLVVTEETEEKIVEIFTCWLSPRRQEKKLLRYSRENNPSLGRNQKVISLDIKPEQNLLA